MVRESSRAASGTRRAPSRSLSAADWRDRAEVRTPRKTRANNADHSRPSAISAAGGDRFAQFDLAIGFDEIADGVTWLGAAAVRVASLVVDRPQTDLTFWSYLVAEIGFGTTALASATRAATEYVTA